MSALDRLSKRDLEKLLEGLDPGSDDEKAIRRRLESLDKRLGLGDFARAVGQGAWSFGDEIEAGIRTGGGLFGDYDSTKAQINSEIAQSYEDYPVAMHGTELLSGFVLPGGNIARGVKIGDKFIKGLNQADTITDAVKIGAVNGAVNGAVDGLGASDGEGFLGGLQNMTLGALFGTGFGSFFGGAAPLAARAFSGAKDPEAILRQVANEAGISVDAVIARLRELGPEATLADAFPVFRQTAQGSVGIGGATDSVGVLSERNAAAPGRLVDEVTDLTGKDIDSAKLEIERMETERARIAEEDYRPVDQTVFNTDSAAPLLRSPLARPFIEKAMAAYASDPKNNISLGKLKKMMKGDPEAETPVPGQVPGRILANARSQMSDRVNTLYEQGNNQQARDLSIVLEQFDRYLDRIPGYSQANANYARNSELIDGVREGRTFAQNANRYGDDRYRLRELDETDPELRGALATGAQSDLINDLSVSGGNRQTGIATSRLGPAAQQQLRLEAAQVPGMANSIARENVFYDTFNQVDPKMQSKTSGAESAKEQLQETSGFLNMANAYLNPMEAMAQALQKNLGLKNKEVARRLTDILLKQGMQPEEVQRLLNTEKGRTALAEYLSKVAGRNGRLAGGALTMSSPAGSEE